MLMIVFLKVKNFLIQGNNDFDTIEVDPDEMRIFVVYFWYNW